MPLRKCQKDNKTGWKWGSEGKCFTNGTDAQNKKDALDQGFQIALSQNDGNKEAARKQFEREMKRDD